MTGIYRFQMEQYSGNPNQIAHQFLQSVSWQIEWQFGHDDTAIHLFVGLPNLQLVEVVELEHHSCVDQQKHVNILHTISVLLDLNLLSLVSSKETFFFASSPLLGLVTFTSSFVLFRFWDQICFHHFSLLVTKIV